MKTFFSEIQVSSTKDYEIINITVEVTRLLEKSGISNGLISIFSTHTTAAIKINENEKNLVKDFDNMFEKLIPKNFDYEHNKTAIDNRPNAHSHLRSMLINSSETIPFKNGKMLLGVWQTIFFIELDGPRQNRKIIVEVIGC